MKKLVRPQKGRRIGGVCAGIGQYFNVDPTFIRIIFLLLLLPGGFPGLLFYLVLWFVIPSEESVE